MSRLRIYVVLAGAMVLIGIGLYVMEIGRDSRVPCSLVEWDNPQNRDRCEFAAKWDSRPPVPCSLVVHWDDLQDRDRCLAREAEVARLQAILRAMREENARIAACDHRSWFGLVGKNECPP
jgi:hypothetical protein